jgi:hypothetical protein
MIKMRSIKRVFEKIRRSNPAWSDYICFAQAVSGRNFSKRMISRYFNKLVDEDDYAEKDKKEILKHLTHLSQK